MSRKRKILDTISRERLLDLAREHEMAGLTGRNKAEIVDALAGSHKLSLEAALQSLSRDELKNACRNLSLDDSGREKLLLIDRLLGRSEAAENSPVPVKEPLMARSKPATGTGLDKVKDYRHEGAKRKNNPPAGVAEQADVPVMPKAEYSYSPRRPPTLRFDNTGGADKLPDLLAEATKRKLTVEEALTLAEALRTQQPWLEWAGKRESDAAGFAVDPVALHIHERISSQAILRIAARQDVARTLFGDPDQEYKEAVQFYRHDIDWTNRLILGDSLQVMASLARREDLAGKVQMIYIDPPYGINYGSNFQPEVIKRVVKDTEADLTREPEMVKAYRDAWHLGMHSYLTYIRDRLVLARELLTDSGSIFVQISDENLHLLKTLMSEVFGESNLFAVIPFKTKIPLRTSGLAGICDYLLWFGKDIQKLRFRKLYVGRESGAATEFSFVEMPDGSHMKVRADESENATIPDDARLFRRLDLSSAGRTESCVFPFDFQGDTYNPTAGKSWKTNPTGMSHISKANRLIVLGEKLYYKLFFEDYPVLELANLWPDTAGGFTDLKRYVVETNPVVVRRCMLMATDPGDLVLDPTCGSGTTAYVAEQWGRRWITIDTSRVAVAIARQRLLTAKYDYYRLRAVTPEDHARNPTGAWLSDPHEEVSGACSFKFKAVPHITLGSIARNQNLDPIFDKHKPILDANLAVCNRALANVSEGVRQQLEVKLQRKQKEEGKNSITDVDRRRWALPSKSTKWEHWQVPFDTDPDWPNDLATAVTAYRQTWRAKMDDINACIASSAEKEELVDQPEIDKNVVRVSGPFTVEAVQPPELSLGDVVDTLSPIGGAPEAAGSTFAVRYVEPKNDYAVKNVEAYLDDMTSKLRMDGVRFPNNKENAFARLNRIKDTHGIHAEGRWVSKGQTDPDPEGAALVGVVFGPQYGPVTMSMVEKLIKPAGRRYDDLVIAAFNFTAEVYDLAANPTHPKLRIHAAHISPDVNPAMNGLLKQQRGSQLFTVFGQPRTKLEGPDKETGDYTIIMEGMDIYNPVTNAIDSTDTQKVAAWFLDGDYDGRTFCITQAFFPDRSAWEKLAKALGGIVDAERFEALSGTVSLPFPPGKHKCAAVKVIDPRGNEVMQVHKIG